ncbi:hypothetical protein SAZ_41500 [Streptomyces noursei ZPM]|nr:hypothetical protein SAZ_41500 [Streptomyces noursei ZPM]
MDLGGQYGVCGGGVLQLHQAAAGDAGGVDDAVERAEPLAGGGQGRAHLGRVGHVGGEHQYLRAELLQGGDCADLGGGGVLGVVGGEPVVPVVPGGECGASHQDEAGPGGAGQVCGEGAADAAESAGDQVDALLADAGRAVRGGREGQRLPAGGEAGASAVGDDRFGGGAADEFGDEAVQGAVGEVGLVGGGADVDALGCQPGVFLRGDQAGAGDGGLLGADRLAVGDLAEPVGDHGQVERVVGAEGAPCLGEGEEAGEPAAPVVVVPVGAGWCGGVGGDGPQVGDGVRQAVVCGQGPQQCVVVLGAVRVDGGVPVVVVVTGRGRNGGDVVAGAAQASGEAFAEAEVVEEQQPPLGVRGQFLVVDGGRWCGGGPGGDGEPVGEVGELAQRVGGRRRRCLGAGWAVGVLARVGGQVDPVPLALERVGGQGDPPGFRPGVDALPVRFQAGQPEPAEGGQEEGAGALVVVGGGQRGQRRAAAAAVLGQQLQCQAAVCLAGPDLQQDAVRVLPQLVDAAGEAHRLAHVPGPVGRIGGFGVGDPGPGDVGEVGDAGRAEGEGAGELGERGAGRFHHPGVEGVRGLEPAAGDLVVGEPPFDLGDRVGRAGQDGQGGAVEGGDAQAVVDGARLCLGERHREHRATVEAVDEQCALGDEVGGVLKGEDLGDAGGHPLADAVADEGLRGDAPVPPELRQRPLDHERGGLGVAGVVEFRGSG